MWSEVYFFFLQMVWVLRGLDEGNSVVLVKGLGVQLLFLFFGMMGGFSEVDCL